MKNEIINSFNDVPTEDLQKVITLAMQMQGAGRLQFEQRQTSEEIRQDAVKVAKEPGVNEWYLDQAAKQWQRIREQQEHIREQQAGAKTKHYNTVITVVIILVMAAMLIAHFIRI